MILPLILIKHSPTITKDRAYCNGVQEQVVSYSNTQQALIQAYSIKGQMLARAKTNQLILECQGLLNYSTYLVRQV